MSSKDMIYMELSKEDYVKMLDCICRVNKHRKYVKERWREKHAVHKTFRSKTQPLVINILNPQVLDPPDVVLNIISRHNER